MESLKLAELRLRNFRCFQQETTITFEDLTALVGRNDAGKSTIMDALDIFFNDTAPDKHDASKTGQANDVGIIAIFTDLPDSIVLDQTEPTSLAAERILNQDGCLEIHKTYNGSLEKPKITRLELVAQHPTADGAADLLALNNRELRQRAQQREANTDNIDERVNAQLRKAIRDKIGELNTATVTLSLLDGNWQNVWKGIQAALPTFAIFRADRSSTDQDAEAQDPLNTAIKEAIKEKEYELNAIAAYIEQRVQQTANLTLQKIREMDPTLATTLSPQFQPLKWQGVFKASISGDQSIPINKRGSGVRRLILLNFFRAKAEQAAQVGNKDNTIYAIEEPETSQHPRNQRLLMTALQTLAGKDQVIITTHTPVLARVIPATALRFIDTDTAPQRTVHIGGQPATDQLIAKSLGVLPDHNVKLFIGVEGKYDIPFLKNLSRALIAAGEDVPDLEQLELDGTIIFTPFGGENLAMWSHRLGNLNRPEFHVYDRDTTPPAAAKYQAHIDEINARPPCEACATSKREAENYIHYEAINLALHDAGIPYTLTANYTDFDDVPTLLAAALNPLARQGDKWGDRRAKDFLCNNAAARMTAAMLTQVDPRGEVRGWFNRIKHLAALNP